MIAAGEPPIMQITYSDAGGSSYVYLWMRPVRLDALGRAVTINAWRVQCKPPPAATPPDPDASQPFYPGLTADHEDCTAESIAALRNAAKLTEIDDKSDVVQAHWVRDGNR
jgi:hypothetical protein